MGRAFQRKGKKGATWYIEYYHQGKQYREKVGRQREGITERMAKKALESRMGDMAKGKSDLAKTKTYPLFSKLMGQYLEHSKAGKEANSYRRDVTSSKHLLSFFGNKRINEITPWLIGKYKMKRKEEVKAKYPGEEEKDISFASINREMALLKNFYSMAIEWGKIDHNPVKGIKRLMFKERHIERYLEEDEIMPLLEACEKNRNKALKTIVITALNTGMRLREVLYLKVSDLDFRNSIVNLEHTKNGGRGKVPMSDYLKGVLKEHLKDHTFEYVFCNRDGRPFDNVRKAFKSALEVAEIKDFRFHDLRHTFASQLALKGVDLYTIQKLMRHKTLVMVMKYAHLSPKHQQTAINALGGLFEDKSYQKNIAEISSAV